MQTREDDKIVLQHLEHERVRVGAVIDAAPRRRLQRAWGVGWLYVKCGGGEGAVILLPVSARRPDRRHDRFTHSGWLFWARLH